MDPNETYLYLTALVQQYRKGEEGLEPRITDLWEDLNDWLKAGGFLPWEWERRRG